jgi:pimeloyl-ACP methyl ester carboxylesterase
VALELAASFPRRVSSLALLDQGLFSRLFLGGLRIASAPGLGRLALMGGERLLPVLLRRLVNDSALVSREWVDDQRAVNAQPGAHEALLATIRSLPVSNREVERMIRTQLSRIAVPILVVWGAEDRLIDVDASRRLFAAWGHARIRVLPSCGHSPQVERPREVNALLAEFVEAAA